ncbi:restriction endonuclease fold toxin [Longimycelium tulufanense]|nr:restriction endonuclease fold toxin [Longimycelium tulufanense]
MELGTDIRSDVCWLGYVLHTSGPNVQAVAAKALAGSEEDRRDARRGDPSALSQAGAQDEKQFPLDNPEDERDRERWYQAAHDVIGHGFKRPPDFNAKFTSFMWKKVNFGSGWYTDHIPSAGKESREKMAGLVRQQWKQDPYFKALRNFLYELAKVFATSPDEIEESAVGAEALKGLSTDDVRRFLQYGGFPKRAPAPGTPEFRLEVEALKSRWASCDITSPDDPYRVLTDVVETAWSEWQAELNGQAGWRNTITRAQIDTWSATREANAAMVEALGQAWIVHRIAEWVHDRENGISEWNPTPEKRAQIEAAYQAARTAAGEQIGKARTAADTAAELARTAEQAQQQANEHATAQQLPRGRALAYAQQSVQVTQAMAAAARAAAHATVTAHRATEATGESTGTLLAQAEAQARALQAEFRRHAAETAAIEADQSAKSAAWQAQQAETQADTASQARQKAEQGESTARQAADSATQHRQRAEAERDTAAQLRREADAQRDKAGEAKRRADAQQQRAENAKHAAENAEGGASRKEEAARQAETRAVDARSEAYRAAHERDAARARAQAKSSAAAAAEGTEHAREARAQATQAQAEADTAADAAGKAQQAAEQATEAAVHAREAATKSQAAAERAQAEYAAAKADAATAHQAWVEAWAARAEAIVAAEQAAINVAQAEQDAATAAQKASKARQDAQAARAEARQAGEQAALAIGRAYASTVAAAGARDAADAVVHHADQALTLGAPYRDHDTSAGMAVLVGQAAKSYAQQFADAAQARAAEADRAAHAAKEAAARADTEGKAAAHAAAQAAASAAHAARSLTTAQQAAHRARADADAATAAEQNAHHQAQRAETEAGTAGEAARQAHAEAEAAGKSATEAERDADGARRSANQAAQDAQAAQEAADRADASATRAEESARNAHHAAQDAADAATRAEQAQREEERRKREQAAQHAFQHQGGQQPGLNDDELTLLCFGNQECINDYNKAHQDANKQVVDWIKEQGGPAVIEIVDELSGFKEFRDCVGSANIEACIWFIIDKLPVVKILKVGYTAVKTLVKVLRGIDVFNTLVRKAKKYFEKAREVIQRNRKALAACPTRAAPLAASFTTAHQPSSEAWLSSTGADPCNNGWGALLKSANKYDPQAEGLAKRIGGETQMHFANDPDGREFDVVSDRFIGEAKPENFKLGKDFRSKARAMFNICKETGRAPYFQFQGEPHRDVIRAIQRYAKEYGIEPVVDTNPVPLG